MRISSKQFHLEITFEDFIHLLFLKLAAIFYRLVDVFRLFPKRIYRAGKLLVRGISYLQPWSRLWWRAQIWSRPFHRLGYWMAEFSISILEIIGLPEIYETLCDFLKFNTRALTKWEIELAREYFGNSINYKRVRIDEFALLGPRQGRFCYVSFYMINSWGQMHNSLFIHELTHIWQYEKMGAVYIPRALWAQKTEAGYNYGGVETLKKYITEGKDLYDFNLEQQGDIVADYYRIKNGYSPNWGKAGRKDLATYQKFVNALKEKYLGLNIWVLSVPILFKFHI